VRYQPLRFPSLLAVGAPLLRGFAEASGAPHRVRKLARMLRQSPAENMVLFNACDVLPDDLRHFDVGTDLAIDFRRERLREAQQFYPAEPLRQAMYLDQHTFLGSLLDRNDRMTMGASIECRTPFLDFRLVERAASLPTAALIRRGQRKSVLRRALGDRLPQSVLRARKWGFGVPWARYVREVPEIRERVLGLHRSAILEGAGVKRTAIERAARQYVEGDASTEAVVKEMLLLTIWHDAYFGKLASLRAAGGPMRAAS
jgi:asparagine synthase (glutamine-hydrolysing)